ncbi:hypothetical protein COAQ111491_20905 [Comamonas aquatilis]
MICSSLNRFFTSNLLSFGIGLQVHLLLKSGGVSGSKNVLSDALLQ